ncbi:hypothetical protein JOD55_000145 [Arcanobacterium pluranimalium]|uniref:hypothetical protein n=1 Tax=Arcanobacterium pluranimalium TaxID=108028 RepID=UPI00195777C2|nr:hypothetical protein [Arcanobacterium pluranimalium]MBM7824318.1 hypothetical protein [Arcanobacterium pluranimalium]
MIYDVLLLIVTLALGGVLMPIIYSLYTESPTQAVHSAQSAQSASPVQCTQSASPARSALPAQPTQPTQPGEKPTGTNSGRR